MGLRDHRHGGQPRRTRNVRVGADERTQGRRRRPTRLARQELEAEFQAVVRLVRDRLKLEVPSFCPLNEFALEA